MIFIETTVCKRHTEWNYVYFNSEILALGNQYFMGWVCGFEELFDLQFTFRYNKDPSP